MSGAFPPSHFSITDQGNCSRCPRDIGTYGRHTAIPGIPGTRHADFRNRKLEIGFSREFERARRKFSSRICSGYAFTPSRRLEILVWCSSSSGKLFLLRGCHGQVYIIGNPHRPYITLISIVNHCFYPLPFPTDLGPDSRCSHLLSG